MNDYRVLQCLLLISFIFPGTVRAQNAPAYPQGYFRDPLAIPILLAGNFGECRPGHFHSGIDIKTEGRENLPVYAAADGYISRIKMEPGGFGHGLYITHPNGFTTLYAHLNNFIPAVQQYVRKQQYAAQSWTVDLMLKPDQFPVKQGDQIAFSGNTGGSTAPHLHFEIRNSKTEHPLNPMLFGLEIKDVKAPVPTKLAIYNRDGSIYNDSPALIRLIPKNNIYTPANDTLLVYDNTGLGLEVNDYMNGSDNTLAFYTAEWLVDDVLQGRIRLDNIGYEETRYLHAYADYKTKELRNTWIQCLFRLPGNALGHIYEELNQDNGQIIMPDNEVHKVAIKLTDAGGNMSIVQCYIRRGRTPFAAPCNEVWKAATTNASHNPNIDYTLDSKVLYDDLCTIYTTKDAGTALSDKLQLGMAYTPAHHYFDLKIKPNKAIPFALRNKIAMRYSDGKNESGRGTMQLDKGWYKASVRNFGYYWLVADTTAPVIKPAIAWKEDQSKTTRISFRITDEITSVKTCSATLDDAWILFEQHDDNWFYEMDTHCPKGKHKLTITATDECGNIASRDWTFTR